MIGAMNRMINLSYFKKLCEAPSLDKAYYRPFVSKGILKPRGIFVVGINPATPIFPNEIDLDRYAQLLFDYAEFKEYYKASRLKAGKTEMSRTRKGIDSFIDWLVTQTDLTVTETNVIAYPTADIKLLKKEPTWIIEQGKDIYGQLLLRLKPRLLILHGKGTVVNCLEILIKLGLSIQTAIDLNYSIEQMEKKLPLLCFEYQDGTVGTILACRHFMYYGKAGDSYSSFRNNVLAVLKELQDRQSN